MGGQVNVRLGDEDDAALTRCAAERGVERATLAKSFVRECLDAWRDGRALFDWPEQLGPGDVVAFGARLDKAVMEIDRIAQSWAAHESDMHKLEREDQLALTRVRAEFIKGMPERITASLNPIRAEMLLLAERIDRQPRLDAIDERQRDHSELLRENTAAIRSLERQPRTSVATSSGTGNCQAARYVRRWQSSACSPSPATSSQRWRCRHRGLPFARPIIC